MSDDRWRDLDDQLGQLGRTKTARVLGWCAVAGWCVFVLVELVGR